MKKLISIILAALLSVNALCISVFAEDKKEEELKKAAGGLPSEKVSIDKDSADKLMKLVKSKIDIPSGYTEFYSEINGNILRLRWSSPTDAGYSTTGGTVEVSVNDKGSILSFSHYKYIRDYEYQRRLPSIPKGKALEIAKRFTGLLCPDIIDQIGFDDGLKYCTIQYEGSYNFSFVRKYKDIPFYENGISVQINGRTGEVIGFSRNWTDGVEFTDPSRAISVDEAKKLYREKIPLVLKYRRTYGEDPDRTYLEYSPSTPDLNCSIDAVSGGKVVEANSNNVYMSLGTGYDTYQQYMNESERESYISEQKIKDSLGTIGFLTPESAEKLARGMEELGIDDEPSLSSTNYVEYGSGSGIYLIRLDFVKAFSGDEAGADLTPEKLKVLEAAGELNSRMSVEFNAVTSELFSVNRYGYSTTGGEKGKYDKAEMKKAAEAFLEKYKAENFKECTLSDYSGVTSIYNMKYGAGYPVGDNSFTYLRRVNGIPFEENQLALGIDPETGKVSYYYEKWDSLKFVPADNVISTDKASETLFEKNGMKLRYSTSQDNSGIKLVYSPDAMKPICIDAANGTVISYFNGMPYNEAGSSRYVDIKDCKAREQIQALAEAGILPEEVKFRPDDVILQKEWLYMIYKARSSYSTTAAAGTLKQKEMDSMYRAMINDGVIDEPEKDADRKMTRETAVKYLLNSMGYKKFATLEGLFNCDFKDKSSIDPKLFGYVAVAKSLKLISGSDGYFKPKQGLTRAEAAVMIYNYLML